MKFFAIPIAAVALGLTIGLAQAEEMKGKVAEVDQDAGIIVLDNGETFTIAEGTELPDLAPGTEVTVSYEMEGDNKVADEVTPSGQ